MQNSSFLDLVVPFWLIMTPAVVIWEEVVENHRPKQRKVLIEEKNIGHAA